MKKWSRNIFNQQFWGGAPPQATCYLKQFSSNIVVVPWWRMFLVPPQKINEPPLKRNHFKRKVHLPSHQFSGDTLVFRGYGTSSALLLSWTAPASAAGCQLQPANEMTSTSTAHWVMSHQSDWGKHSFLMSSYSFRMMKASRTRMIMMIIIIILIICGNGNNWLYPQSHQPKYLPTKYTHSLLHEQHLNNNPKSLPAIYRHHNHPILGIHLANRLFRWGTTTTWGLQVKQSNRTKIETTHIKSHRIYPIFTSTDHFIHC